MQRIDYEIKNRDALFAQLAAEGKAIIEDVAINLDENGRPTTCYCVVCDVTEPGPDLLAEADARILALEYENLLLKGGLNP